MADIYVRPYDSGRRKPVKGIVLPVLFIILVAATWWWLRDSSSEPKPEETELVEVVEQVPVASEPVVSRPTAPVRPSADTSPAFNPGLAFDRARSLIQAGKPEEASALLDQVIGTATDPGLKNSAYRLQGRANLERLFSEAPNELKTSYIIQPGDSLDRIARNNKTTVELIRQMNNLEGNLIYPGARLRLPAGPFVVKVDKSDRTLQLVLNGEVFKRYIVGVGKYGKTPVGTFHTVVHQTNPDWTRPGGGIVPYGDPENVLGTRWISIHDDTQPDLKGFGIHGTADRTSIGAETSNGCIRMLNEDVEEVFLFIPRGTTVTINE